MFRAIIYIGSGNSRRISEFGAALITLGKFNEPTTIKTREVLLSLPIIPII
jgi:hypothetical protein